MDRLVDDGVKALVIACNSASAATLRDARERYDVPVIEVVHPAVRRAVVGDADGTRRRHRHCGHHHVGRLRRRLRRRAPHRAHDDGLPAVRRVRRGGHHLGPRAHRRRARVPRPDEARRGVDTLVLGCTHYPLLTGVISYVMGEDVTLVSSAEETAKDVYRTLVRQRPAAAIRACPSPRTSSLVTGDPADFQRLGRRFLGPEIGSVEVVAMRLTVSGAPGPSRPPRRRRRATSSSMTATGSSSTSATARSARCRATSTSTTPTRSPRWC